MDASFLSERLETARTTFASLERQLADPDVAADPVRLEPIARERARLMRLEFNRNGTPPDWAKVELDIIKPLTEVRQRIAEELARRDSDNPAVVIDRDPVPTRHTAAVQKYSEEVGKGALP